MAGRQQTLAVKERFYGRLFRRNPAIILVEDEPDILIILHRLMRDLTGGVRYYYRE